MDVKSVIPKILGFITFIVVSIVIYTIAKNLIGNVKKKDLICPEDQKNINGVCVNKCKDGQILASNDNKCDQVCKEDCTNSGSSECDCSCFNIEQGQDCINGKVCNNPCKIKIDMKPYEKPTKSNDDKSTCPLALNSQVPLNVTIPNGTITGTQNSYSTGDSVTLKCNDNYHIAINGVSNGDSEYPLYCDKGNWMIGNLSCIPKSTGAVDTDAFNKKYHTQCCGQGQYCVTGSEQDYGKCMDCENPCNGICCNKDTVCTDDVCCPKGQINTDYTGKKFCCGTGEQGCPGNSNTPGFCCGNGTTCPNPNDPPDRCVIECGNTRCTSGLEECLTKSDGTQTCQSKKCQVNQPLIEPPDIPCDTSKSSIENIQSGCNNTFTSNAGKGMLVIPVCSNNNGKYYITPSPGVSLYKDTSVKAVDGCTTMYKGKTKTEFDNDVKKDKNIGKLCQWDDIKKEAVFNKNLGTTLCNSQDCSNVLGKYYGVIDVGGKTENGVQANNAEEFKNAGDICQVQYSCNTRDKGGVLYDNETLFGPNGDTCPLANNGTGPGQNPGITSCCMQNGKATGQICYSENNDSKNIDCVLDSSGENICCNVEEPCSDGIDKYYKDPTTGKCVCLSKWAYDTTTKKAWTKCIQGYDNKTQDIWKTGGGNNIFYDDHLSCIRDACNNQGTNACCAEGYNWDEATGACYVSKYETDWHCDCHADDGACGPGWRAHCHGSWNCYQNCCNNGGFANDDSQKNRQYATNPTNVPQCSCEYTGGDSSVWFNMNTGKGGGQWNIDEINKFQCKPGKNTKACFAGTKWE